MKKNPVFLLLFLFSIHSFAQKQFWGMTSAGGNFGKGCIFNVDSAGNQNIPYSFDSYPPGSSPLYAKLVEYNGKFYGVTSKGGTYNEGVLFEYDPATDSSKVKFNFRDTLGSTPNGYLLLASNGKFYGTTTYGGINNDGTIFQFDPVTGVHTKVHDLDHPNGYWPYSALAEGNNGFLYGTTQSGAANNTGAIFEFQPGTNIFTKKIDFNYPVTGAYQFGALTKTSTGKLYGMNYAGGANNAGVLYEYDPSTNTFTKRLDFDVPTGANPFSSFTEAPDGKLYGTTSNGGVNFRGVIFVFDTTTYSYTKLYDFDYTNGSACYGMLTPASNGKYYGLASDGANTAAGNIFEFDITTNSYVNLYDFNLATEGYPDGSLAELGGILYGVTSNGAVDNAGILFKYDIAGSIFTKVNNLDVSKNGGVPNGSLLRASNGRFYGLTNKGGAVNQGVLFEYDALTGTYSVKHDFTGSDGSGPQGSLMQATNGKLYGMTGNGGLNNYGVIFEYDPVNGTYLKRHDFDSLAGSYPYGDLTEATNGLLYGMTSKGGTGDFGIVFSFDPSSSAFQAVVNFDNVSGANPFGSLLNSGNGKLYGMTSAGGASNNGVIFEFFPASGSYYDRFDFNGTQGANPFGNLVELPGGVLYGMTKQGGLNGYGVIFNFDTLTKILSVNQDFDYSITGRFPMGSLLYTSDSLLLGLTSEGGTGNKGTLFKYNPSTSTFAKLQDFTAINGSTPQYSNLTEVCLPPSTAASISGPTMICSGDTAVSFSVSNTGADFYIWSLPAGATISSGDSTNSIVANFGAVSTSSGNVVVKGVNSCGTGDSTILAVSVSVCTGIHENFLGTDISVSPNPSENVFNITLNSKPETVEITVLSMEGKLVLKNDLKSSEGLTIDLTGFPRGIYQLQLKSSAGLINKKLVLF